MRHAVAVAALVIAGTASAAGAGGPPGCPTGTDWTRSITDSYGETTYRITGPCFVTFPADFLVTVTVSDPVRTSSWVGSAWTIVDTRLDVTGASTTIGSGPSVVTDPSGLWTRSFHDVYSSGTPVNHTIKFNVTDLGQGASAGHYWTPSIIGTITYDPYPEAVVSTDPGLSTTGVPYVHQEVETTGCGTSGALPALLGLAALGVAAWPRRRARR